MAKKKYFTDAQMQQIFGLEHPHILYFNYDLSSWNKSRFLGHDVHMQYNDAIIARDAGARMDADLAGVSRDVVAMAIMPIEPNAFPGVGAIMHNPYAVVGLDDNYGLVGTFVLRNSDSGRIASHNAAWIGIGRYLDARSAVDFGPNCFSERVISDAAYRANLIMALTATSRQRGK